MNKKGFTTIELITTFGLVMVIALLLLELVVSLKQIYVQSGIKAVLLNKQAIMTKNIYDDFSHKEITIATNCGTNCLLLTFDDSSEVILRVDKDNKLFTYGTYTTKLDEGSSFGDIDVTNKTISGVSGIKKDSMIVIHIPIHNKLVDGDFGIHVVYQYNSRTSSITDIAFGNSTTEDYIFLKGATEMYLTVGTNFQDPGFFTLIDGALVNDDSRVKKTGSVDINTPGTYELTYQLYIDGSVKATKVRKVVMHQTVTDFVSNHDHETYTVPATGYYKLEAWGAQGGSAYYNYDSNYNGIGDLIPGGAGAYTRGTTYLEKGQEIYIYVGRQGLNGTKGVATAGGYNGGGDGGKTYQGAGSGGGATDFRLVKQNTPDSYEASLRSRIMVAGGGAGASNYRGSVSGGSGGDIMGLPGKINVGNNNHTVATGGTQTHGGSGGGSVGVGLSGTFGQGGNAGSGHGGGGGGGYYGGGGGGYISSGVSSGAGGSSYISGHPGCIAIKSASDTTPVTDTYSAIEDSHHYSEIIFTETEMIAGNKAMPNYDGTGTMLGNASNGHARITYLGIEKPTE